MKSLKDKLMEIDIYYEGLKMGLSLGLFFAFVIIVLFHILMRL